MLLNVLGRTRTTLDGRTSLMPCLGPCPEEEWGIPNAVRDGDSGLQLFPLNEECLVSAIHQIALIASLPLVHTARRCFQPVDAQRPFEERPSDAPNSVDACRLEEAKVVTRFL